MTQDKTKEIYEIFNQLDNSLQEYAISVLQVMKTAQTITTAKSTPTKPSDSRIA